jgi:hypothetical protein
LPGPPGPAGPGLAVLWSTGLISTDAILSWWADGLSAVTVALGARRRGGSATGHLRDWLRGQPGYRCPIREWLGTIGSNAEGIRWTNRTAKVSAACCGMNLAAVQPGAGSFLGDSGWVNPQLAETVGLPGSADCWCRRSLWGEPAAERAHSQNGAGRVPAVQA